MGIASVLQGPWGMFTSPMELTVRPRIAPTSNAWCGPRPPRPALRGARAHPLARRRPQLQRRLCRARRDGSLLVARWKRRFADGGVLALADDPRAGRQDHRLSPAVEAASSA